MGKARTCPRVPTAAVRVGTAREERAFAHPTLASGIGITPSCSRPRRTAGPGTMPLTFLRQA